VSRADVVVVVPAYRPFVDDDEARALRQCFSVLGRHPIVIVAPRSLRLEDYPPEVSLSAGVVRFDDRHFADRAAYSDLLLTADFYRRFMDYRYMLLYQLDAFVFEDRLQYWCGRGFSYIGAPWVADWPPRMYRRTLRSGNVADRAFKRVMATFKPQSYHVGNGGFSLRRVQHCYWTARAARPVTAGWHRN